MLEHFYLVPTLSLFSEGGRRAAHPSYSGMSTHVQVLRDYYSLTLNLVKIQQVLQIDKIPNTYGFLASQL